MSRGLQELFVGYEYNHHARELIAGLKFGGAQSVAKEIAILLAPLMSQENRSSYIVPIPTAAGRARHRGFDQAKLIARAMALKTGMQYTDMLARHGKTRQVGASRSERQTQLHNAFTIKQLVDKSVTIILVDDILTTGATFEAAALALQKQGFYIIKGIAFAQA